jgi:hypothetical protein
MPIYIASLMPTATKLVTTGEPVDFMLGLIVERLWHKRSCESENDALLITSIEKRHSTLWEWPAIDTGERAGGPTFNS